MKVANLLSATALVGAMGILPSMMFSAPAFAQTERPPAQQTPPEQPSDAEVPKNPATSDVTEQTAKTADGTKSTTDIVVTGSRIRRDAYSTIEPITVISEQEITQLGFNSAADALQSTAITGGTSQINNYYGGFVTDGGTGANTLGLRGLGPSRTLILLNGHRLAPAGTRGSVGSTDLNVLPTAMINRIEVLKAGASSIYGSDAVAGVVNVITKRNLNGLYLEAQRNIPEVGAGGSERYSGTFGYSGDRLNFGGSVEYYNRQDLQLRDRSFTQCPTDYLRDGNGGGPGTGDFIDPRTGQPKCFPLNNGGVSINTLGVATRTATPALGVPAGRTRFNRLRPNAAIIGGPTPGYEGVGGTGVNLNVRDTFNPASQQESLVTPAETYTGYLQGSYKTDVLGNAEFYAETLINRRKSRSIGFRQLSLDYPIDLVFDANGDIDDYGTPNPLVPAIFQQSIFALPTQTTNGKYIGVRAFVGFGNLESRQTVDFVKLGGGVRGDITPLRDWKYDAYFSKTWSDGSYTTATFLTDRLANATDTVQNADGSISCRTSAPACVPLPALTPAVIGGNFSDAFRHYITADVTGTTKYRESVASLAVDGPLFRLPAGPVQVALGVEYRSNSIDDTPPIDSQNGNLFNLTSATPTRGKDRVFETYGELSIPLLRDKPFFYNVNLDVSGRYTDYRSYGSNETYKVAGEWQFFRGIGVRGSYGTSYRAPALFEQFLGATSGFLSSTGDPCNDYGNNNNTIVRTNCASEGLAPDFTATSSITVLNAGGAGSGLKAETSKNLSGGVVLHPRFGKKFGDLSIAVDYFAIEVDNGVSRLGTGAILNKCYTDPQFRAGGGFCRLVTRAPNNTLSVNNNYVNLATDKVRGLDYNVRYSHDLAGGVLTLDGQMTQYFEQSNRLFADDPIDEQNGIITVPELTGTGNVIYTNSGFTLRYGIDYIKGDSTKTYKYFEEDKATSTFFLQVPDYFRHTVSAQYAFDRFSMTVGVRNFTDSKLPRISSGVFSLYGNAPLYSGYDYVGRTVFVNFAANF